jgi:glycosyltransferase involved in cell wall biosynthesis
MRILHIIDTIGLGGGAERNLVSVVPAMVGHRHHVLHFRREDDFAPALRAAGAVVERATIDAPRDVPAAMARVRELAGEVDVVHTQTLWSDVLGRAAALGRAPIVTSVQTPPYAAAAVAGYSRRGKVRTAATRLLDIALSTQNERFVAVSGYVRDVLVERVRVPYAKVDVVYNAVDVEANAPPGAAERAAARASLGLGDGDVGIVSAGKLVAGKGQYVLVEAMPALLREAPGAVLLLAGTGSARVELEQRARALGVAGRVRFLGLRADMARVLSACDIFALASHFEGLSLAVAEAMAARLPCVLSPIEPHVEMAGRVAEIDEPASRAMVVPSMRPDDWARAFARLAGAPADREALGEASRVTAGRHFNVEATAPALLAVLARAAGQRASS